MAQCVIGGGTSSCPIGYAEMEGLRALQTTLRRFRVQGSGFGIPGSDAVSRTLRVRELPWFEQASFPLLGRGQERVDGAERPSTLNQVWSCRLTVASIPQSANEDCVDSLRGTTPPP